MGLVEVGGVEPERCVIFPDGGFLIIAEPALHQLTAHIILMAVFQLGRAGALHSLEGTHIHALIQFIKVVAGFDDLLADGLAVHVEDLPDGRHIVVAFVAIVLVQPVLLPLVVGGVAGGVQGKDALIGAQAAVAEREGIPIRGRKLHAGGLGSDLDGLAAFVAAGAGNRHIGAGVESHFLFILDGEAVNAEIELALIRPEAVIVPHQAVIFMGIELTAVDDVGAGGVVAVDPQGVGAGKALEVAAVDDELGVAGPYGSTMSIIVTTAVELTAVDDALAARLQVDGTAGDKMADVARPYIDILPGVTVTPTVDSVTFIPGAVNLLGAAGLQLAAVDEELAAVFDANEAAIDVSGLAVQLALVVDVAAAVLGVIDMQLAAAAHRDEGFQPPFFIVHTVDELVAVEVQMHTFVDLHEQVEVIVAHILQVAGEADVLVAVAGTGCAHETLERADSLVIAVCFVDLHPLGVGVIGIAACDLHIAEVRSACRNDRQGQHADEHGKRQQKA